MQLLVNDWKSVNDDLQNNSNDKQHADACLLQNYLVLFSSGYEKFCTSYQGADKSN